MQIFAFFAARSLKRKTDRALAALSVFRQIDPGSVFKKVSEKSVAALSEKQKYRPLVRLFDETRAKVRAHNEEIARISEKLSSLLQNQSAGKFLENPRGFPKSDFSEAAGDCRKFLSYRIPAGIENSSALKALARDFCDFEAAYDEILAQFDFLKAAGDAEREIRSCDRYIDSGGQARLRAKIELPLAEARRYGNRFYKVPDFDGSVFAECNEAFIARHLRDAFFDDIDAKSLDDDQRRAVLCDARSNLTIAGAGSGKTLTICAKVKWILRRALAAPDEILLLSYSRASADDLAQKISAIFGGGEEIKVKTFHALGLEILAKADGKRRAVSDQLTEFVTQFLHREIFADRECARLLLDFVCLYPPKKISGKKYESQGDLLSDARTQDFVTLKDRLASLTADPYRRRTLKNEFVKSREELVIANFLFTNGIAYEYERAYERDVATEGRRQYTPDFYLPDYGIYIEHFGIDRDGNTPQYSDAAAAEYKSGIEWKRRTHAEFGTVCIETYSYEFDEGTIFENLTARLSEHGVALRPVSDRTIDDALRTIISGKDFSSLLKLTVSFLSLYKAQFPDEAGFSALARSEFPSRGDKKRAEHFLAIAERIYAAYVAFLRGQDKIDFDDMILKAGAALDGALRLTDGFRYKYIIVDEFQDISQSRLKFLQKLLARSDAKLFAVGDDWQAIYRFTGCDVSIFLNFERLFPGSVVNKISATHRNSAELLKIAEPFVTKNPEQFRKNVRSDLHEAEPVKIIFHDHDRAGAFISALGEIGRKNARADVLVLGRNRRDADDLQTKTVLVRNYESIQAADFPQMRISYKTVHQSKGLEAEFVILISGEDSATGFPNKTEDDPILELVLGRKSPFRFAEERRLFYVALTRTKREALILSDKNRPSEFVKEIEAGAKVIRLFEESGDAAPNSGPLCPWCKSGKLVLRRAAQNLRPREFYGCGNYPYCRYTAPAEAVELGRRCKVCGDFLTVRSGRYGKFYGCLAYPKCTYAEQMR